MQKGASFNLEAVKAQIQAAIAARTGSEAILYKAALSTSQWTARLLPSNPRRFCHFTICPLWVISGHYKARFRMSALPSNADVLTPGINVC
jgi:hypothetical protein